MEIEAKVRIETKEGFEEFKRALGTPALAVCQRNVFLDDAERTLSSQKIRLRLRFYSDPAPAEMQRTCLVTRKMPARRMHDGVAQEHEDENTVPVELALKALESSDGIEALAVASPVFASTNSMCKGPLESIGEFSSYRDTHPLAKVVDIAKASDEEAQKVAGLHAEVDSTTYSFGQTLYEVEIEARDFEQAAAARAVTEKALSALGIAHRVSTRGKFNYFIAGTIDP